MLIINLENALDIGSYVFVGGVMSDPGFFRSFKRRFKELPAVFIMASFIGTHRLRFPTRGPDSRACGGRWRGGLWIKKSGKDKGIWKCHRKEKDHMKESEIRTGNEKLSRLMLSLSGAGAMGDNGKASPLPAWMLIERTRPWTGWKQSS